MRDLDNHFGEYVHLQHFQRETEALHILRKIASCVKPIMRKRGWRVGSLCEFYPDQSNLLGLNVDHGYRINIRLRYAGDANQFLPFNQVLDTMLHELVHIVQGEHNDRFYKIWDELRDEWYTLQLKGYTGEGFLGKGSVLGGQRVPVEEARRRARATALERQKHNKLQKDPGHRLGGSVPTMGARGQHMRDIIANAVQRRNKTERATGGCGTGNRVAERAAEDALKNGFRTKAEMDDANDAAIAQALIELMEQEEERVLQGLPPHPSSPTLPPPSEGLTWDPENGLQPAIPPAPSKSAPPPVPTRSKPSSASQPPTPRPASTVSKPKTTIPRPPRPRQPELNSGGRPVSRLVAEAEAKKKSANPQRPTRSTPSSTSLTPPSSSSTAPTPEPWECAVCTLFNEPHHHACEACETPKPGTNLANGTRDRSPGAGAMTSHAPFGGPQGWNCWNCGSFMESQWWTCSLCGSMKATS